jgi:hypothetical protein
MVLIVLMINPTLLLAVHSRLWLTVVGHIDRESNVAVSCSETKKKKMLFVVDHQTSVISWLD